MFATKEIVDFHYKNLYPFIKEFAAVDLENSIRI
jgi:hypothetical protein